MEEEEGGGQGGGEIKDQKDGVIMPAMNPDDGARKRKILAFVLDLCAGRMIGRLLRCSSSLPQSLAEAFIIIGVFYSLASIPITHIPSRAPAL